MSLNVASGKLVAATTVDWNEFIPDKLVPAIFDTVYMVSVTMVIAGLLGLVIGALLYTTRQGNILQKRQPDDRDRVRGRRGAERLQR